MSKFRKKGGHDECKGAEDAVRVSKGEQEGAVYACGQKRQIPYSKCIITFFRYVHVSERRFRPGQANEGEKEAMVNVCELRWKGGYDACM